MRRILLALTLLAIFAAAPCAAAELRLDAQVGSRDAESASRYLRDPTGSWTLRDVISRSAAFRPAAALIPDVHAWALSPSTLWFRLEPRSPAAGPWYLHASLALDYAELYYVAQGRVTRMRFGTLVPYSKRRLPAYTNVLELPDGATREGTLYLRVVTREDLFGGYSIRPAAWEATTGRALADDRLLPELVILGVIGGLALFNGLLGVMLRERIYYWYAAATGCFAVLEFMTTGAAWRWFWPNAALLFDVVVYPAYLCYFALMLLFAREFLNLAGSQTTLWRALFVIFTFGALVDTTFMIAPNVFDDANVTEVMDPICSGLLLSAVLASGIIAWRRKCIGAAPYTIAFAGVLCGIFLARSVTACCCRRTPGRTRHPRSASLGRPYSSRSHSPNAFVAYAGNVTRSRWKRSWTP